MGNVPVRIVGALNPIQSNFSNSEQLKVYLPYTTVMHRTLGQSYLASITVRVGDSVTLALDDEPQRLTQTGLPAVDAGMQVSLLARRPELSAAELRLRSTLRSADATRASYLPGPQPHRYTRLLQHRSWRVAEESGGRLGCWTEPTVPAIAPDEIRHRHFQGGLRTGRGELPADALRPLGDVENNLAGRRHYTEQEAMRERALASAKEAERIYRIRYESGAESLQSWLTAQETRRNAEITLAENRLNKLLNYVALVQSLGGDAKAGTHPDT
ncbi:hypothetical protein MCN99_06210 [Pseudomonas aeruginosa]|nr:hypothetical protein MCN99_06210 [Pseudomonas aeruginosa]